MRRKKEIDDGGPAFPLSFMPASGGEEYVPGMSLRMWLAGQIANRVNPGDYDSYEICAADVFAFADALIRESKHDMSVIHPFEESPVDPDEPPA